jgi:hypothetical protein
METKQARRITAAIAIASLFGIAGVVGVAGTVERDGATLPMTRSASVHASADALERRALSPSKPALECDTSDFGGSADAFERQSARCLEPAAVFYGSPDSLERQGGR